MENKAGSAEKIGMSRERLARIQPSMQKYIDNGMLCGMTTMVARKGGVVYFEQQGYRDEEAGKLMTAEEMARFFYVAINDVPGPDSATVSRSGIRRDC